MAAARIQRWALYLGAHNYTIEFRQSSLHTNVDGLSRLPLDTGNMSTNDEHNIFHLSQLETLPIRSEDISRETRQDPILSLAYQYTLHGWQGYDDKNIDLRPYYNRRHEISIQNGCLMWGIRVIIPTKFRDHILDDIHSGHLGVVKMKSVARSYVYWPSIDSQIEQKGKGCTGCASVSKLPPQASLHPWEWPDKPWRRLHIDFAGPYLNKMFLVVVDAHSKWPEVIPMHTATSATTIQALRNMFAKFGLPDQIVSDNGSQFCSDEFQSFLKVNGIRHIRSAPYHPSTNGLAERFVQSFKLAMKSAKASETTIHECLARYLIAYRNAAHNTTQASPASLMFGRPLRTRLDLINPTCSRGVLNSQSDQITTRASRDIEFQDGESVLVRDYRSNNDKWQPATVLSQTGPVSYKVNVPGISSATVWRRHSDQMRSAAPLNFQKSFSDNDSVHPNAAEPPPDPTPQADSSDNRPMTIGPDPVRPTAETLSQTQTPSGPKPPLTTTRVSSRIKQRPQRLIENI